MGPRKRLDPVWGGEKNDRDIRTGTLAIEITKALNPVLGPEHLPIDVIHVAREYSAQRFPGHAITLAEGGNLPGFNRALYRLLPAKPDGASSTTMPDE
jgi:hypothetical protein